MRDICCFSLDYYSLGNYPLKAWLAYKFARSKSSGKISSQLIMFQRFYFFALSKWTGIEIFISFRTCRFFFLLRANQVYRRVSNRKLSNPTRVALSKTSGVERLCILSNSTRFARSKKKNREVLNEKKLWIPVNLISRNRKTSEILANQKSALYVERIFSHSIC